MNFLATWFEEERTQHVILKIATQLFLISGYRCMESKHTIPLAARCADSVFCSSMCIFLCFLQRKLPPVLSVVTDLYANLPLCPGPESAVFWRKLPRGISPEADRGWGVGRRVFFFLFPLPPNYSLRSVLIHILKGNGGRH